MVRLGLCIDRVHREIVKVLISEENARDEEEAYMKSTDFETIFRIIPREGLFLEIEVNDITEKRRHKAKELQQKILDNMGDGIPK
jgi:hypothetical protein